MQLTIATYNVHHCEGLDGVVDVARIAAVIERLRPDVVALQELDEGWERSGAVDQAAELAHRTGLSIEFWPTFAEDDKRYGFALGAPEPFESEFRPLPGSSGEEPRGAALAWLESCVVIATHLSTRISTRFGQKKALAGLVNETLAAEAKGRGRPVILLGDLNHRPLPWGVLRRNKMGGSNLAGGRPTPTFPSDRPRRHIDHILVSSGLGLRAQSAPATTASDHRPLVAEVLIP